MSSKRPHKPKPKPKPPAPAPLHVEIQTDGTAKNSQAFATRGGVDTFVPSSRIARASCSVRKNPDGSQVITATVWVAP